MRLHLVRHARVLVDPAVAPTQWHLDPAGRSEIAQLREELPSGVPWISSPETKAVETARLLTDEPVEFDEGLREQVRPWEGERAEFEAAVGHTLANPHRPARPGWETGAEVVRRLERAIAGLRGRGLEQAVLVGHGTAWTLLVAHLSGRAATLADWAEWATPDLRIVEYAPRSALDVRGEVGKR